MRVCVSCTCAVMYAMLILGIAMAVYAMLACTLYGAADPDSFGSFSRAFFTMFQVISANMRTLWCAYTLHLPQKAPVHSPLYAKFQPSAPTAATPTMATICLLHGGDGRSFGGIR